MHVPAIVTKAGLVGKCGRHGVVSREGGVSSKKLSKRIINEDIKLGWARKVVVGGELILVSIDMIEVELEVVGQ